MFLSHPRIYYLQLPRCCRPSIVALVLLPWCCCPGVVAPVLSPRYCRPDIVAPILVLSVTCAFCISRPIVITDLSYIILFTFFGHKGKWVSASSKYWSPPLTHLASQLSRISRWNPPNPWLLSSNLASLHRRSLYLLLMWTCTLSHPPVQPSSPTRTFPKTYPLSHMAKRCLAKPFRSPITNLGRRLMSSHLKPVRQTRQT